jgi:hypothetical protein
MKSRSFSLPNLVLGLMATTPRPLHRRHRSKTLVPQTGHRILLLLETIRGTLRHVVSVHRENRIAIQGDVTLAPLKTIARKTIAPRMIDRRDNSHHRFEDHQISQ